MKMTKELHEYRERLIALGFKPNSASAFDDAICYHWIKRISEPKFPEGHRLLDVQLWTNGKHRISHMIYTDAVRGLENTTPTEFTTVAEMLPAIEFESTRQDNRILMPW
jgi:hypothetical protein